MDYATWSREENEKGYAGHKAYIATNRPTDVNTLPWAIYLADGRRLSAHGSYDTAYRAFLRYGLVA